MTHRKDDPHIRDTSAALACLAGIIVFIVSFDPLNIRLFLLACSLLLLGFFIAIHKVAAMGGAFLVLGFRFIFLFFIGKGPIMLILGLACGMVFYAISQLELRARNK